MRNPNTSLDKEYFFAKKPRKKYELNSLALHFLIQTTVFKQT